MMDEQRNITALIVTYNRLDKLKICLSHYANQVIKPTRILVVDNCSNKDTYDFLENWSLEKEDIEKVVLHLDKNYGGSGGFYYGMKKAMELGFDWLWIADDDAYPDEHAFETLNKFIDVGKYQAICGAVYSKDGNIQFDHRQVLKSSLFRVRRINVDISNYNKESVEINVFSFVGTALSHEVIEKCGYPIKDYVIWCDDTEYGHRVNANFKILFVPSIKIRHDSSLENQQISWKTYYGNRNLLDMQKKHYSKLQYRWCAFIFKLRLLKKFFTNRKYYIIMKDAYNDFKHNRFGISEKYKPGAKI